jgi:hypothetical protein
MKLRQTANNSTPVCDSPPLNPDTVCKTTLLPYR